MLSVFLTTRDIAHFLPSYKIMMSKVAQFNDKALFSSNGIDVQFIDIVSR